MNFQYKERFNASASSLIACNSRESFSNASYSLVFFVTMDISSSMVVSGYYIILQKKPPIPLKKSQFINAVSTRLKYSIG